MNGGMYHKDWSPVGLYVENGQELKRASTANGPGNFHMKPNGVFFATQDRAGVVETGRYLRQKPKAEIATQSGPMLVIDGRIHPKISEEGISRKVRNGVGVRDPHTVIFAISDGLVTFGQFARLFRDALGCNNALFLDGSVSSLYAPALNRADSRAALGADHRRGREAWRPRPLKHDPEKWEPVFGKDHARTNQIERDDRTSKKNHPALAGARLIDLQEALPAPARARPQSFDSSIDERPCMASAAPGTPAARGASASARRAAPRRARAPIAVAGREPCGRTAPSGR